MSDGYVEKSLSPIESDIEKINRFTKSNFDMDSLYVFSVVLCNNDIDRDCEKFSIEALNDLAVMFVGKTGISDHSMKSSDQRARIFDAWVEKVDGKKTADGEDLYVLKAKAYMVKNAQNESLITDIEAGIKKEVSISCSMGKSVCSICGADKRTHACPHINGREYDNVRAYSTLFDAKDAYEFSFVAVPAQKEAGVTKAFEIKEYKNMDEIFKSAENLDSITLTKSQLSQIKSHINNLEEDAELGREYKKSLSAQVICLCAKRMPEMDIKVFTSVASVMTVNELLAFKDAFSKMNVKSSAKPQFGQSEKIISNDEFKI